MSRARPFQQVDVFTDTACLGNPLAVVLDGTDLSTEEMQRFTDWTNLSECTFVLPPSAEGLAAGADYRVRIFCPGRELPFAGHPTLGTCHAWLLAGGRPRAAGTVVQECGVGLVPIRQTAVEARTRLAFAPPPLRRSGPLDDASVQRIAQGLGLQRDEIVAHAWCDNGPGWQSVMLRDADRVRSLRADPALLAGGRPRAAGTVVQECGVGLVPIRQTVAENRTRLAFAAPPLRRSGPLDDASVQRIAQGLGLQRDEIVAHAWCDNGPGWQSVMLRDAARVRSLRTDPALLAGMEVGVVAPQTPGRDTAFEVRAFFPGNNGLTEDPVTGSLNAALAQWLIGAGLAPERYVAAQGTALGRAGRVHVERDGTGNIWIGGDAVTCIQGTVHL